MSLKALARTGEGTCKDSKCSEQMDNCSKELDPTMKEIWQKGISLPQYHDIDFEDTMQLVHGHHLMIFIIFLNFKAIWEAFCCLYHFSSLKKLSTVPLF